jgi:hypothetical protein
MAPHISALNLKKKKLVLHLGKYDISQVTVFPQDTGKIHFSCSVYPSGSNTML